MIPNLRDEASAQVTAIDAWFRRNRYRGYEPFDGLSSPLAKLTFGNLFLERVLQQLVRRIPFNVRPLIGVSKKESTKGRGYLAWGHLLLHRMTGDPDAARSAREHLDWLLDHPSPRYDELSWGNHFDFSSRIGKLRAGEPIIVWTSLIGRALLTGYEVFGDDTYRSAAESVGRWILGLPREKTELGSCLSYVAFEQRSIHNASMLGAGFLARLAVLNGDEGMREVAKNAMHYSCARQLPDGSWYYGEEPKFRWIDNFHTGYNLDSLKLYTDVTGDDTFSTHLDRGLRYYLAHFFEEDGAPKYYQDRLYPIDSQAAAQSIETLCFFARGYPEAWAGARRTAAWVLENMTDRRGRFFFRSYGRVKDKTPMIHWTQAVFFKAFVMLLEAYRDIDGEVAG